MTPKDAVSFVAENDVKIVDIRFVDLFGYLAPFQHPRQPLY